MRLPKSYSGRDAGKYIIPLIENAKKNIKIISPFISDIYANLLMEKARNGLI